jgi:hypothetical protein
MPDQGAAGQAEVKIRLVLDDSAASTTHKMQESMGQVHSSTEKAKGEAEGLTAAVFKGNAYFAIAEKGAHLIAEGFEEAFEMATKFGEASLEAADEMNQQVRAMGGLMTLMDRGEHSMQQIGQYAGEMREDLEKVSIQAGMTMKDVTDMYESIIERGGVSTEKAFDFTEQMALVGKIIPGGARSIADGFSMMELGIVRARNPLVQLIAATGTLHGNAHAVAQQMMKMTPEKQIATAREAIEKQYEIMKKGGEGAMLTPTLGEVNKSLGTIRESFLEAVGQPMLDSLIPRLVKLRDFLSENMESIKAAGEKVGHELGRVIEAVDSAIEGIYAGVEHNWNQIDTAFHTITDAWKTAWTDAVGDTATIYDSFEKITASLIGAFTEVSKIIKATVEVAEDASDLVAGRAVGTTQAYNQGNKVLGASDQIGAGSEEKLGQEIAKYRQLAQEAGIDQKAIDAWTSSILDHHNAVEVEADKLKMKVESQDTDYISRYINQAIAVGNDEAEVWALHVLAQSDGMATALKSGAIHIDGGFESLTKVIEERVPELAEKLKQLSKGGVTDIKGHGPSMNMYGGQTFNIKQDFRDADPDRVIVQFRRDIVSQVVNRRQSHLATPFGL